MDQKYHNSLSTEEINLSRNWPIQPVGWKPHNLAVSFEIYIYHIVTVVRCTELFPEKSFHASRLWLIMQESPWLFQVVRDHLKNEKSRQGPEVLPAPIHHIRLLCHWASHVLKIVRSQKYPHFPILPLTHRSHGWRTDHLLPIPFYFHYRDGLHNDNSAYPPRHNQPCPQAHWPILLLQEE